MEQTKKLQLQLLACILSSSFCASAVFYQSQKNLQVLHPHLTLVWQKKKRLCSSIRVGDESCYIRETSKSGVCGGGKKGLRGGELPPRVANWRFSMPRKVTNLAFVENYLASTFWAFYLRARKFGSQPCDNTVTATTTHFTPLIFLG